MDPAKGAIDSLLPKLDKLLSAGKLPESARKQVVFLQEELKGMELAFSKVEDVRADKETKEQIKLWLRQARPLSYGIEHVIDKFEARRLWAAHLLKADRHKLIGSIRFLARRLRASRQFAKDVHSYRDHIRELHIQLLIRLDPAKGAIGSLLPKLEELVRSGKLRKGARKQVFFLQQKLTQIQHDSAKVKDVEWVMQARTLSYSIEYVVDKFPPTVRPAACCHQLTSNIRSQLATMEASRQFATDMQSYRDRIMELNIQLIILMGPERGPIDSLLPKLKELLSNAKLRKKSRKEVAFLQEKMTGIQFAFHKVGDAEWDRQARALSYRIDHIVDKFLHHRLRAANPPTRDRHKLIGRIRFKLSIKTSHKFTKDIQSYRDRIMELEVQVIHSLLPELERLLITGKLRKKERKEVTFFQEKLTGIQRALGKVEQVPVDQRSMQIKEWAMKATALIYDIKHVVHEFLARRLRAAHLPAAYRHKLINRIEYKLAIADASRQFTKDIQSYRDRIMEVDLQVIYSLLPELEKLLMTGKLRKKARKEVIFLQEKLPWIQHALGKVEDMPADKHSIQIKDWDAKARALIYDIKHVVNNFLAHRLKVVHPAAAYRHKLIIRIDYRLAIAEASRQFVKDIQSYKDRIMEVEKQLISYIVPAMWSIDGLLQMLDKLLTTGKLQNKVRIQVVFLKEKLTSIQCASGEVGEVEWVKHVRALSYDIEHAVDKFLAHRLRAADHHKLIGRIRSNMAIAEASSKFANDIQSYKDRIMKLDAPPSPSLTHTDFSNTAATIPSPRHEIAPSSPSPADADFSNTAAAASSPSLAHANFSNTTASSPSLRQATAMAANDHDGSVEELFNHEVLVKKILADEDMEQPVIVSILGGASEVKTELLNQVYQKFNSFECTAWVTVSQEPDMKNVLWNILCQISLQDDATFGLLTVKETIGEIKKTLNNKRYFIVVDDLWDITAREIIKCALIENSKGSAILMTSHKVSVARFPGVKIYRVGPLSENSSRELSGTAGDNCPPDLVGIPKKISEDYSGTPSAISKTANLPAGEAKEDRPTMPKSSNAEDLCDAGMTSQQLGEDNLSEPMQKVLIEEKKIDANSKAQSHHVMNGTGGKSIVTMSAEENLVTILNKREGQPLSEKVHLPQEQQFGAGDKCPPDLVGIPKNISEEFSGTPSAISNATNLPAGEAKEGRATMPESSNSEDLCDAGMTSQQLGEGNLSEPMEKVLIEEAKIDADSKAQSHHVNGMGGESIVTISAEENLVTILNKQEGQPLSEKVHLPQEQQFGAGYNCSPDLEGITEEIFEECSGTPPAISNVANFPACEAKEDPPTMLESSNSEDSNAMGGKNRPNIVLPEYLKSCLLYLNMFQHGYKISEDRLLSGWIAEGYIPEQDGEKCLKDLRDRDLIKAVKTDADGRDIWCLNDTGHKLITSFSAEENSVTILKKREGQPLPQTIGRLAIQGHADLAQEKVCIVRSLIVSDGASSSNDESSGANVMQALSRFENLRVLELGGCGSLQNYHLNGIKSLLLLRYLVIGGGITDFPKNIDRLVFLQTLDLRATRVKKLPGTIVRARQLKCLRVNERTKMPRGIGKMEALEELGDMNISNTELLKELSDLTKLTILRIVIWAWDDGYKDELLRYLGSGSTGNMKSLSIFTCCSLHIFEELKAAPRSLEKLEIRHSSFLSLPGWIYSLENLSSLSIEVYKLSQKIIGDLGKLHNLRTLSLKSKQALEGNFNDGFLVLTSFSFATNDVGRIFEPGAMEKVEEVHLSCQVSHATEGFDFGLEYLPSLKHAYIEILCFHASFEMVEKAKNAIEMAKAKDPKLDFYLLPDKIESETQAEHDTTQQNQRSSPSTSASESMKNVASSPAGFCDRCGFEFSKTEYQFCPGCGTRRLTAQKK